MGSWSPQLQSPSPLNVQNAVAKNSGKTVLDTIKPLRILFSAGFAEAADIASRIGTALMALNPFKEFVGRF
jgi:hypothetical protein